MYAAFEADRFFPNLDEKPGMFFAEWSSRPIEENGVKYQFIKYVR